MAVKSGLMGALGGAAVGTAVGVMLSDQDTRQKLGSKMGEFRDRTVNVLSDLQENVSDTSVRAVKAGRRVKN